MPNFSDRLALKADQTRLQVLNARRQHERMTCAQAQAGYNWFTADAFKQRLKIAMSLSEAVSLVRVIGPLEDRRDASQMKCGGPTARFLAAIHVVRQAVLKQPTGGLGVSVALSVLRVALDELECSYSPPAQKKPVRHR